MELPTWKGAYCPHCVNPLSVRLFNQARGEKKMCENQSLQVPRTLFWIWMACMSRDEEVGHDWGGVVVHTIEGKLEGGTAEERG